MTSTSLERVVSEYREAFNRCYPHHVLKVLPRMDRQMGAIRYAVYINGELGERTLSEHELRSATLDFNRGKGV